MRLVSLTVAFLIVAANSSFGDDNDSNHRLKDPKQILKKAAEAAKKASRVTYDAEYHATNWITQWVPNVSGHVVVGKQAQYEIDRFQCDVTLQQKDSEEKVKFTAGCDGNEFFVIDPKTKLAHQDMDQAVLGSNARDLQRVVLSELGSPTPYRKLMEAETIELRETRTVEGEECYVVFIKTDEPPEMVWCFSVRDFIPRHVERLYDNEQNGPGSTLLTLSDVKVNPKLDRDPFKLVTPDGYTKTDEFAP